MAQRDQLLHMKNKDEEAEKSAFERFEEELKDTIFGVLFLMLKDEEMGFWKQIVFMLVSELQVIGLIFNPEINFPWKATDFAYYFEGFLQIFHFLHWCTLLNWGAYLIIFYVCVGILVVMILNIIYVSYTFSHKQTTMRWALHLLSSSCGFAISIFFFPFLEIFASMFQCKSVNGVSVHFAYDTVQCWKNMHILYAVCGVLSFIAFFIICIIVALCFFESRLSSGDPAARMNSRNEFMGLTFKFICIIFSVFFMSDEYRWVNVILYLIGSIGLYAKQINDRQYYTDSVNVTCDVMNGIFMWSASMLLVAMFTEDSSFDGGFQIYLTGLPIVVLLLITKKDSRRNLLLKKIDEFDNGEKWHIKVVYLVSLIQKKEASRDVSVQLKGYIYNHEETCTIPSCPIKTYINNITTILKDKKKKQSRTSQENFGLLMRFVNLLFIQGTTKFPTSTALRLTYAFFLKERMNNRTLAISELLAVEKCRPPFDEQFVMFRYRKIIEDEMTEVQTDNQNGTGALDVISMIAFDNYLRQLKESVERSALLHMEFWLEVLEAEPDLGKLDNTGTKIHAAISAVEECWSKLQKISQNAPKALKIYADFLREILNDEEAGTELLSREKETANIRANFNANVLDVSGAAGMGDMCAAMGGADGTPCIIASGEHGKLGEILQFNMAVCRLYGYTKAELIGRKINMLMPEMYSKAHDQILQRCINTSEDVATANAKSDMFVLGRHKSGYLIPNFLQARMMTSVAHGTLFAGTFKQEKKGFDVCYALLDEHQDIVGISSKCISTLGLTNHLLKNSRVSLQTLVPGLQDKSIINQFVESKSGTFVEFFLPETSGDGSSIGVAVPKLQQFQSMVMAEAPQPSEQPAPSDKLRVKASKKSVKMMCVMSQITISGEPCGYFVRLEQSQDIKDAPMQLKLDKQAKYPNLQFAFDPIEMKYIQEDNAGDLQMRMAEQTSGYVNIMRDRSGSSMSPAKSDDSNNRADSSMIASPEGGNIVFQMQQALLKRKKIGEGIKTRQLVNGEEKDIEDKCRLLEKQEDDEDLGENVKRKDAKDKKDDVFQNSLKSKKAFNAILYEKSVPSSITKLRNTGYIIILILIALASIEFGLTTSEYGDINSNIDRINDSHLQIEIQMKIVYYIQKIVLLMKTTDPRLISTSINVDILAAKKIIQNSLNEYYSAQNLITLSTISLSSAHSSLYTDKCVSLYYKDSSGQIKNDKLYTLTEAIQQLASETFTVQSFTSNSLYAIGNDDIDFILYNAFADLYKKMKLSADYFVQELESRGTDKLVIVYILYAIALFVLMLSICFLFPVVASVSTTRLNVLCLFFDIPQNSVRTLEKKCEKFIAQSNNENIDEINSSEGDFVAGGAGGSIEFAAEAKSRTGRSKRKFKNNTTSNGAFYLQFLAAVLVVASYFSFGFAFGYIFLHNVSKYARELNATTAIHAETAYSFTVFQSLLGQRRLLMSNENQTFNLLALQEITAMYNIASELQNSHNDNYQTFTQDYQDTYINLMRNDLCVYSDKFGFTFDCQKFLDGTIGEGLHPVIINFIEDLREQLASYLNLVTSNTNSSKINSTITNNFLKSTDLSNMEITIFSVIDVVMRYLINSLLASYDSKYNTEITTRIIVFICFLVALLLSFMILWAPFVNRLNEQVLIFFILVDMEN